MPKRSVQVGRKAGPRRAQSCHPPAIEIETNQEYLGVDLAITDSNFNFADYVDMTVKVCYFGGLMAPHTRVYEQTRWLRRLALSGVKREGAPAEDD